jgi:hypothetical protein
MGKSSVPSARNLRAPGQRLAVDEPVFAPRFRR